MKKLLLFALFFTFTINFSLYAKRGSGSFQRVDFWLTMPDGIKLDCTKLIPNGSPPSGGWKCAIVAHGFGLSKFSEMPEAEDLASEGYYTLVYSMRGQGFSEGQSNFISIIEANDLKQVVQYVKNDNNTNDNRIAIHGGSQGGILPFMAVATGMQVRTLITDLASPEAGSNWIENGNIKMTLLWSLSYPQNIVRYNSLVSRFRTWVLSSARDKWDSLIYFLPQNREFLSQVGNCQIPILIQNTWQDRFFNTLGMIRSAYILPYNNYRMYFGPMDGHGSDYNINEEIFKEQIYGDWLDYHQLNIQNNVMNVNEKFTYCLSSFPTQGDSSYWSWQRFYSPTWPPNGVQNIKLYFHPGGLLHMLSYSGSTSYFTFLNDVLNPNVSMETLANYEFNIDSLRNRNLFDKREVIFETPALLQNARLMGTPYVYLYYYSDADLCQINMQLFEVEPNGNEKLVTRINWTDRYNIPNVVRQKYVNGQAIGHLFKAGNRLRIKITNIDSQPPYKDFFLRTNPFVLPVLKRANNRIYVSGSSKSYIELPMLNFVIGIHQISSEIPNGFKLHQNYPNPFNPITKIRFEVPPTGKNNYVQIKVYDVAGKELTTLVDENLNTGVYETDFDGSNFASGVYFYRIVSGNYSKVKKMILVK